MLFYKGVRGPCNSHLVDWQYEQLSTDLGSSKFSDCIFKLKLKTAGCLCTLLPYEGAEALKSLISLSLFVPQQDLGIEMFSLLQIYVLSTTTYTVCYSKQVIETKIRACFQRIYKSEYHLYTVYVSRYPQWVPRLYILLCLCY